MARAGTPSHSWKSAAPDERGVVGRAAGDHLDAIDAGQAVADRIELLEADGVAAQPSGHGRRQRRGLLVDLLEHEVRVAALLGRFRGPRNDVDGAIDRRSGAVRDRGRARAQIRHVAVGQEDDPLGVGHDRRRVRGQEALAVADADDQRGVQPGADQAIRLVAMHHHQGVGALEPSQGGPDRVGEIAFVGVLDEVGHDLRVRLGLEDVSAGHQLVAQLAEVLDDAVVDDGDPAGAVAVRMGVEVARPAVRGPARVAEADAGTRRLAAEGVLEDRHLAGSLLHEQVAVLGDEGDAGGVVAPVLEPPQPVEQDGAGFSRSGVSDDSAHARSLPVSATLAPGEGG